MYKAVRLSGRRVYLRCTFHIRVQPVVEVAEVPPHSSLHHTEGASGEFLLKSGHIELRRRLSVEVKLSAQYQQYCPSLTQLIYSDVRIFCHAAM